MQNPKRILMIRSGAVGDMIYATAVIDALQQQYSSPGIELLTTPSAAALFSNDSRINAIHLLRHRKLPTLLSPAKRAIVTTSKRQPYDILINLESARTFFKLANAISAHKKVGYHFQPSLGDSSATQQHNVDAIKALIQSIIDPRILAHSRPKLFGAPFEPIARRLNLPSEYIIIHASNSHNAKRGINYRAWPLAHWKRVLQTLPRSLPVVLIGTMQERAFYQALMPFQAHHIDAVGNTSLGELITLIAHAKLIITTDTGPVHLASAMKTPTIALIGPTPAYETGPYQYDGYDCTILSSHQPCAPCYKTDVMRACTFNACMHDISVDMVMNAIMQKCKLKQDTIS